MLSRTAEYALRAVVCLADPQSEARTTREIARQAQVPPDYLSKVLKQLSRAGIVRSQRGRRGGVALGRPASALTILQIVQAVDPEQPVESCPLDRADHNAGLCPLHQQIENARKMIEKVYAECTIEALLTHPSRRMKICPFPRGLATAEAGRRRGMSV